MGSIERRLARLEADKLGPAPSLTAEELEGLSDGDLDALEEATEAGVQEGRTAFEDLQRVVGERSRRSMRVYFDLIAAERAGEEPHSPPDGEATDYLGLIGRITAGDEEARREWESRNGYHIWKYRK